MKILKFTEPRENGILKGFFDLYVDELGFDLYGCTLFVKGDGTKWINVPSKEFTNELGEKKFKQEFKMHDDERHKKFREQALVCVMKYCEENCINLF